MIEEKNSLSPIYIFQHKNLDRKINDQEAVVRDLIKKEKEIMSWFGKADTTGIEGDQRGNNLYTRKDYRC